MEKSVQLKENIFRAGFNTMFNRIRDMLNLMERRSYTEDDKVIQTYTRSLPMDLSSLSDSISKLKDVVSRRTLMTQLEFVSDASLEEQQLRIEKEADMELEAKRLKMMATAVPQEDNNQDNQPQQPKQPKNDNDNQSQ